MQHYSRMKAVSWEKSFESNCLLHYHRKRIHWPAKNLSVLHLVVIIFLIKREMRIDVDLFIQEHASPMLTPPLLLLRIPLLQKLRFPSSILKQLLLPIPLPLNLRSKTLVLSRMVVLKLMLCRYLLGPEVLPSLLMWPCWTSWQCLPAPEVVLSLLMRPCSTSGRRLCSSWNNKQMMKIGFLERQMKLGKQQINLLVLLQAVEVPVCGLEDSIWRMLMFIHCLIRSHFDFEFFSWQSVMCTVRY